MRLLALVNLVRFFTLLSTILALSAHAVQCFLFTLYQRQASIHPWFPARHWQYLLWFIALGISFLSAVAVCIHAGCCRRAHNLRGDRSLGSINCLILAGTLTIVTLWSDQEPWTDGLVEFSTPAKGFIPYCGLLDRHRDAAYPLLYHRCLLIDTTWICGAWSLLNWILLAVFSWTVRPARNPTTITRMPTKQYSWGQYRAESFGPPPAPSLPKPHELAGSYYRSEPSCPLQVQTQPPHTYEPQQHQQHEQLQFQHQQHQYQHQYQQTQGLSTPTSAYFYEDGHQEAAPNPKHHDQTPLASAYSGSNPSMMASTTVTGTTEGGPPYPSYYAFLPPANVQESAEYPRNAAPYTYPYP